MSAVETIAFSREAIRRALRAWDSIQTLGAQLLADLNITQARRQAEGYSDAPAGRGLALQEVLRAAIDSLKPAADQPDLTDRRWRPYLILTGQYLHGRAPDFVAGELHVSRRTYFAEQEQALQAVADVLCTWEEQAVRSDRSGELRPGGPAVPFLAPPRPVHMLVGRDDLLSNLKHRLLQNPNELIALQGLPGAGKTALAIELAHTPEMLAHFSDGVLWAGLGRGPDVLALLGAWAAALGVSADEIAQYATITRRAQAVHAAISLHRMLLVIDDAWQASEALAFKVGGPHCAYVLTTRFPGIALDFAGEGVVVTRELDVAQGYQLLAQLAPQAVAVEPDEARALVQAVGGLPLALILMGGHLRKISLGAQARRLRQALTQLQAAATRVQLAQPQSPLEQRTDLPPDTPLSLQTIIDVSAELLEPAARQALCDLALFEPKPNTFGEAAALAVTKSPVNVLDALVDYGLVESVGSDRYTLHQTIADYARSDVGSETSSTIAIRRFVDYFTTYAHAHAIDYTVLDGERANLLRAVHLAFDQYLDAELIQSVLALHPYLINAGLCSLAEQHLSRALDRLPADAARPDRYHLRLAHEKVSRILGRHSDQCRDIVALKELAEAQSNNYWRAEIAVREASAAYVVCDYPATIVAAQQAVELAQTLSMVEIEAHGQRWWGQSLVQQGRYLEARAHLERALALAQPAALRDVAADALRSLGRLACDQSDYTQSVAYFEQSLRLAQDMGDRVAEARTLGNLGFVAGAQCDYARSRAYHEEALRLHREVGNRRGECTGLLNVGSILSEQGELTEARRYYEQALSLSREVGVRSHEAMTINNLGVDALRQGDYTRARDWLEQALGLYRAIGDHHREVYALLDLSWLFHVVADHAAALDYAQQSLAITHDVGDRSEQARASTCLGHALVSLERLTEAVAAYEQAVALRHELKHPLLATEPLAGLAQIAFKQREMAQALAHVEEILNQIQTDPFLSGASEPFRVYLVCYQVLSAAADPRATTLLARAYQLLHERAAKITDEGLRHSFLENVAAHREIIGEYDRGANSVCR